MVLLVSSAKKGHAKQVGGVRCTPFPPFMSSYMSLCYVPVTSYNRARNDRLVVSQVAAAFIGLRLLSGRHRSYQSKHTAHLSSK